jgi:L-lysine cyclodeaminase
VTSKDSDGTLVLGLEDIRRIADAIGFDALMDELIAELTAALAASDKGDLECLPRVGFSYTAPHLGVLEWMPVMQKGNDIVIKVVAENPGNAGRVGLPTIIATMTRYELATGRLLAIVDGVFSTALRTGAASAIASRALARPDSAVLGVIGCGAQAVTQIHALSRVFDLRELLVSDPDQRALNSLAGRVSFTGLQPRSVPLEQIEREADILCTCTTVAPGAGPVLAGLNVKPSLHINAVGADMPGKVEMPLHLWKRGLICTDYIEQALVEGECQQLRREDIDCTLGTLLANPRKFESFRDSLTVFDSTGFAVEDKVVLELLCRHAERLNLGRRILIESALADASDPYSFRREQGRGGGERAGAPQAGVVAGVESNRLLNS